MAGSVPERIYKLVVFGANAYVTQGEVNAFDMVRDIDSWSPRMRDPFMKLYGHEYFQKMWNENLDSLIVYMKERDGK